MRLKDLRTINESGFQINNKETRESVLSVLISESIRVGDVVGERNESSELAIVVEKAGPPTAARLCRRECFTG